MASQIVIPSNVRPIVMNVPQPKVKISPPMFINKNAHFDWGTFSAEVAALFAVLSFAAIVRQLQIANKQIRLANDQIRLAREQIDKQTEANDLALKDIEINMKAFDITSTQAKLADAERAKKPDLVLYFKAVGELRGITTVSMDAAGVYQLRGWVHPDKAELVSFTLQFIVRNKGSKSATNIHTSVGFPGAWHQLSTKADQATNMLFRAPLPAVKPSSWTLFAAESLNYRWESDERVGSLGHDIPYIVRSVKVQCEPGRYSLHYLIIADDYKVPEADPYAIFPIEVGVH